MQKQKEITNGIFIYYIDANNLGIGIVTLENNTKKKYCDLHGK